MAHNRLRRALLVEGRESGPGSGEAVPGFAFGIGQMLTTLLDFLATSTGVVYDDHHNNLLVLF